MRKEKRSQMMDLNIPKSEFDRIEKLITSDASPVGIDAKKTHVLILYKLIEIERRLERLTRANGSD